MATAVTFGLTEGSVCECIKSAWKLRSMKGAEVNSDVLDILPDIREYTWEGGGERRGLTISGSMSYKRLCTKEKDGRVSDDL